MEFIKVLKGIQNKNVRKKGVKAYYNSGQVFFSRLFGYERVDDHYLPIPKYAEAIELIFEMLIDGQTLPEIKKILDSRNIRDSSNNLISFTRIISIAERPIYSGYLLKGWKLTRVNNVQPIITLDLWRRSQKYVKIEKSKMLLQK